ncbi:MAG: hypothetical protein V7763_10380 [Sulfitobacter sp.]|tara:strand:- start:541 stop:678 length:138 start_codon:yes stop_codon:yes gene_type:complete
MKQGFVVRLTRENSNELFEVLEQWECQLTHIDLHGRERENETPEE